MYYFHVSVLFFEKSDRTEFLSFVFAWSLENIKDLQQMKISLVNTKILYKFPIMKNISMQMEFYPCEIA